MSDVKLTKNELRSQQNRLSQLLRYLPTLQLKKALLQNEVLEAKHEIALLNEELARSHESVSQFAMLFSDRSFKDLTEAIRIEKVEKIIENIAGVEIPVFKEAVFAEFRYPLYDTPLWVDSAIDRLKELAILRSKIEIGEEKKAALEKELRDVTIKVNLFEKNLIPRSLRNIRKIKVFLGDMELSAVSRAKVAKTKIVQRNEKGAIHA